MISTEDKIEIKANKKIVLIAGGSQIEISSGGVLPTTPAKFEAKAGQHKFVGGAEKHIQLIELPTFNFTNNLKPIECPIKSKLNITTENMNFNQLGESVNSDGNISQNHQCTSLLKNVITLNYLPPKLSGKILNYDKAGKLILKKLENSDVLSPNGVIYTDPKTGQKSEVLEYDFSEFNEKFDLAFDQQTNEIIATTKLRYIGFRRVVLDKNDNIVKNLKGEDVELPYDSTYVFNEKFYKVLDEEIDNPKWLNDSDVKSIVEKNLNKKQFYLAPRNCSTKGCICKIKIKLKIEEDRISDRKIYLHKFAVRPNADHWGATITKSYLNKIKASDFYSLIDDGSVDFSHYSIESWIPEPNWKNENAFTHEVGHLFNWVDEYFDYGGSVHKMYINTNSNPPNQIDFKKVEPKNDWKRLSTENLMGKGALTENPLMQNYYMNQIRDWFSDETGISWGVES